MKRALSLLFSSFCLLNSAFATTWQTDGSRANVQFTHDTLAVDGDTIVLPVGTFSWTAGVTISKAITLIGQTTTDPLHRTANDQTIILDHVVRTGGVPILLFQTASAKRLSGITLRPGPILHLNYNGAVKLLGNSASVRVDHCHFDNLQYQAEMIRVGGQVYGVLDHNVMSSNSGNQLAVTIYNGGTSTIFGDDAWAAPANYGGGNFIFIEDNSISNFAGGSTDDFDGGRWVFRHNHVYDSLMQTHGTECCRDRGGRAHEIYNNDFHFATLLCCTGGLRSGSLLSHDNTFDGVKPNNGIKMADYRAFVKFHAGPWGGATGDNVWDSNDPTLFASGSVSNGTINFLTDASRNWTPNQWLQFTAKRVSDGNMSAISSSISNTLNMVTYVDGLNVTPTWTTGDQYQIHKVLVAMDQPCRGQGDLIQGDPPVNTATGTASWPRNALEPCYSWNDIYTPNGTHLNLHIGGAGFTATPIVEGRDFFNNTPMPGYTPYVYPHPLVSGAPTPTPTPLPTATPSPTPVPSPTPSPTPTPSATPAPTPTPSPSPTPTPSTSPSVTPTPTPTATPTPTPERILLTASGTRQGGKVVLNWTPSLVSADIYRDGSRIAQVANSAIYTDHPHPNASYTYQVCDHLTGVCSNEAFVVN
jgi:hypothetical protein